MLKFRAHGAQNSGTRIWKTQYYRHRRDCKLLHGTFSRTQSSALQENIGAQRSLRTRALRRSGPGCLEGAASARGTCRWALKRGPRRCRGLSRRPTSPGSDEQPARGVRRAVNRLGLGSSQETRSAAAPPGGDWRYGSDLAAVPGEPSGEPSGEPNGAPGGRGAGMGRGATGGSDSARPGPATCAKGGPSRGPGLPIPPHRAATGQEESGHTPARGQGPSGRDWPGGRAGLPAAPAPGPLRARLWWNLVGNPPPHPQQSCILPRRPGHWEGAQHRSSQSRAVS